MSAKRKAGAVLIAATLLVACSDDDNATPRTTDRSTTTESPSTVASTTAPATSTTAPAEPSTTVAPTTTLDEVAATQAAVAAAVVQNRQDYLYAVKNYGAPDALDVLSRTTAIDSPSWALTLSNIDTLRSNGWLVRDDPRAVSMTVVESDVELLDGPPATRAQVTICTISSGIVYMPANADGTPEVIVNDEIVSRRTRVTMVIEDGMWKAFEGTGLGSWTGATSCPAA